MFPDALNRYGDDRHLVLFYEAEQDQVKDVARFLRTGLERGEKCLCFTHESTAAAIRESLADLGVDLNACPAAALSFPVAADSFLREACDRPEDAAARLRRAIQTSREEGFTGLRLSDGLFAHDPGGSPAEENLLRFEALLDRLTADDELASLCRYHLTRLPRELLRNTLFTHPLILYQDAAYENFYHIPGSRRPLTEGNVHQLLDNLKRYSLTVTALRTSETRLDRIVTSQADALIVVGDDGMVLFVNPAAEKLFGRPAAILLNTPFGFPLGELTELEILRPDRETCIAEMRVAEIDWHGEAARLVNLRDVTRRKTMERELRRTNRALQTLTATRRILMRGKSEEDVLQAVCDLLISQGGYRLAWIGYAMPDEQKTVRPIAWSGFDDGYLEKTVISWGDTDRGRGPTGTAIRTGRPRVCRNIMNDPRFIPWREDAIRRGYGSSASLPLPGDKRPLGALNIYAAEPESFDDDEVALLSELASDLAYGIRNLRLRQAKEETERKLQQSELYHRTIIEGARDLITIMDADGFISYQSPSSAEILGFHPEELTGTNTFSLIHPDDRDMALAAILEILNNPEVSRSLELRLRHRDGSWRIIEALGTYLVFRPDCDLLLVNGRDITERVNTAAELRRKAYELGERVKEQQCLHRISSLLARDDSPLETTLTEVVAQIPPAVQFPAHAVARIELHGREYRTGNYSTAGRVLARPILIDGGRMGEVEFRYRDLEPELDQPLFLPEEEDLLETVAQQIANAVDRQRAKEQLRQSEKQYRTLFETMVQGVVYQDTDGRITEANPAASRILGLTADQLLGLESTDPGWRTIHEDGSDFPGREHPSMQALRSGEEIRNVLMGIFNPRDADYRWLKVSAIPQFREGETRPYQVYATFDDITPLKHRTEELTRRADMEKLIAETSTRFIHLDGTDLDAEIHRALREVGRFVGADRSYLFRVDDRAGKIANTHEWCAEGIESQLAVNRNLSLRHLPWWRKQLQEMKPILVPRVADLPAEAAAEQKLFEAQDIRSLLCVPMIHGGRVTGFLGFDAVTSEKTWAREDVLLLGMLAEIITMAQAHQRAEKQLRAASRREKGEIFLSQFRRLCRDAVETEPVFEAAVYWLAGYLDVARASVWLSDENGRDYYCWKEYDREKDGFSSGRVLAGGKLIRFKQLLQDDRALAAGDVRRHPAAGELLDSNLETAEVRAMLASPIKLPEHRTAFLLLKQKHNTRRWHRDEVRLVVAVADQIALAMEKISERHLREQQMKEYTETLEQSVLQRTMELEEARQLAETASQAKSEFLANMSHELRTPLNSVIGFAEVINDGLSGPVTNEQREYLGYIVDSGEHLLNLINDILDLSKIEAGKMSLNAEAFNVSELLEQALTMFREKAARHGITMHLEVEPGVEEISADRRKLLQVMVNLLSNALKFTPDGGEVDIFAQRRKEELRLTVRDTGIGIAHEDLPRLFKPFQQLETSTAKQYQGTGLGLSLCRKLVELHHGRIEVESRPGAGSSFHVILPVEPGEKTTGGPEKKIVAG